MILKNKHLTRLEVFVLLMVSLVAFSYSQNAPVTTAPYHIEQDENALVPISVVDFNDIGAVSLTIHYDEAIALATNVLPHSALGGNFSFNTGNAGEVIISWYNLSGITLSDNSELFIIEFQRVKPAGITQLEWFDVDSISCEYAKYDGGAYTVLFDSPTSSFYINGQLEFLPRAPSTYLPDVYECANSIINIPVKVTNFNDIGAISLTMHYDPAVLVYQGFIPHSSLPTNFIVEADISGILIASGYVTGGAPGIDLPNDAVLFEAEFEYLGGTTNLEWFDDGHSCEYASADAPAFTPLHDTPQNEFYHDGLVAGYPRPEVSVSGTTTIYKGQSADVTFDLTGTPPWELTYSDGTTDETVTDITSTPYIITVSPQVTTTYKAVQLSDEYCEALEQGLIGEAVVTVKEFPTDITLAGSDECGHFSVILTPKENVDRDYTKIVFTVKWEAKTGSDVELIVTYAEWPDLTKYGNRVLYNGYYYQTFASSSPYSVNWIANNDYPVLEFVNDGTGSGITDFEIITVDFSSSPEGVNTAYYIEVDNYDETGVVINDAKDVSLNCSMFIKTFLQGAYSTSVHGMRTDLNTKDYLPYDQPYINTPAGYAGDESATQFAPAVVDWVLLELRSAIYPATMVTRKAALVLDNGDIVSAKDQNLPPVFNDVIAGNSYYIVVYHRNHLPVMTAAPVTFPNNESSPHDFTVNPADNVYEGTDCVILLEQGVYGQAAGDVNMDNRLKYTGSNNDRSPIFLRIQTEMAPAQAELISVVSGYFVEDLNMDGDVKYTGSGNDRAIIINNISYFTGTIMLIDIHNNPVPVDFGNN